MVTRDAKSRRFPRWRIFFPNKPGVAGWKKVVCSALERGRAKAGCVDISARCLELRWPSPVAITGAARIVSLCQEEDSKLEILGEPAGHADCIGAAGCAARTAAASASASEGGPPEPKRFRVVGKNRMLRQPTAAASARRCRRRPRRPYRASLLD